MSNEGPDISDGTWHNWLVDRGINTSQLFKMPSDEFVDLRKRFLGRDAGPVSPSRDAAIFEKAMREQFKDLGDLLLTKHADYGPHNIADAPGGPLNGLNVRLHDKMCRLKHLAETGADPNHEAVRDTYRDIANYGAIALMVIDGQWPGVPT